MPYPWPNNFSFERWSRVARVACLAVTGILVSSPSRADNPIIQTLYTADPAPMVHEGRLYLYTTHDEDNTVNNFFTMNDWRVYSTTDVVNWTDHGSPLHYRDFSWASGNAWAGQVIYRNEKFYFYVPVVRPNGGNAIGVAVADNPIGPFVDAINRPLVTSDCGDIDPTVFIDDDDQAYLYWGNPQLCYVKLNNDMTSYTGSVVKVNMNTGSFGVRGDNERPTAYEEGPWFYKRAGTYYMVYPGGPLPEHIAYATSSGPTGPWTYRDVIMPAEGSSFTNHPGVVDFGGKSLFFYHNGALPGGGGFKRSVAVEEFTYNADGSIPRLTMTKEGASAVATLDPFQRVEAETIAWKSGVETEVCSQGGMNVTNIDNGDYIKLKNVDFRTGATSLEVSVAATNDAGSIEFHLDSAQGTSAGVCSISSTGGADQWATQTCELSGVTGEHDVFLVFTGGGFKFDWWRVGGPGEAGEASDEPDAGASTDTGSGSHDSSNLATETSPAGATSSTSNGTSTVATSAGATGTSSSGSTSNASTSGPVGSSAPSATATATASPPTAANSDTTTPSVTEPSSSADAPQSSVAGCGCRVGAPTPEPGRLLLAFGACFWVAHRRLRSKRTRRAV